MIHNRNALSPPILPCTWAASWGEDSYGLWQTLVYNDVSYTFRWVEPGTFMMGSPENEPERESLGKETQHQVTLTQGFWLGETTVTQALWQAVMNDNPSHFKGDDRPVERVSWNDSQTFITTLNNLHPDLALALPSEAEWEYACRAGTQTPFSFGDNITPELVNYDGEFPYNNAEKGEDRGKQSL